VLIARHDEVGYERTQVPPVLEISSATIYQKVTRRLSPGEKAVSRRAAAQADSGFR
jgi:hypothetical protein